MLLSYLGFNIFYNNLDTIYTIKKSYLYDPFFMSWLLYCFEIYIVKKDIKKDIFLLLNKK